MMETTMPPINLITPQSPYTYKYCNTCNIFRPPRSKHCNTCNTCVYGFDHHCPWIGNCIASNNYNYFVAFLISVTALVGVYVERMMRVNTRCRKEPTLITDCAIANQKSMAKPKRKKGKPPATENFCTYCLCSCACVHLEECGTVCLPFGNLNIISFVVFTHLAAASGVLARYSVRADGVL